MKHKSETKKQIANLMGQNISIENYFSDDAISKNKNVKDNESCSNSSFVVEWQMEHDKQSYSAKFM